MQEAPIHQSHVYGRIKILQTSFEKGHQRYIPVKLFQNLTSSFGEEDFLRISSCPYIVQEAPIHQRHVFGRVKISQTIFEKGHPRNIPAKLFQNLTSGFGEEDFLRISSCPYGASVMYTPSYSSSVHVCIYFEWFPLWLFLELDYLLWDIVLEVSGPFTV